MSLCLLCSITGALDTFNVFPLARMVLIAVKHISKAQKSQIINTSLRRRCAAVYASVSAILFCTQILLGLQQPLPIPMHTSILTGQHWLHEVLNGHPAQCHHELGMSAWQFALLWMELMVLGSLMDGNYVSSQKQLAIFVYWMVHGSCQHELISRFQRSGDTISWCICLPLATRNSH